MNTRISGLKHLVIYLVIVALVGAGGWFGYSKWYLPTHSGPQSHQMQGQITGIGSNDINVYGTHVLDNNPVGSDFSHPVLVKVNFDSNTKYVMTAWSQPTQQDFTNAIRPPLYAKKVDISKPGLIGDLRNQLGMLVVVKTVEDSSGKSEVIATEVDYSLPASYTGYGFSGQITKIEGNTVSASGLFFVQNSPAIFMSQGARNVSLTISSDTKLTRMVIPKIDLAKVKAGTTPAPVTSVQVTLAQLATDIATDIANNKSISFSAISQTNAYGQLSFTPATIYYSIFPPVVK